MRSLEGRTFLHLIHRYFPFRGGSENYFKALSERLAGDGAEVHLFTTDAWDLEYFWDRTRCRIDESDSVYEGVHVHRLPVQHLPVERLTHRGIRRLMGELSRFEMPGVESLLTGMSRFGPWLPGLSHALQSFGRDADLIHPANIGLESMVADSARFARRHDIPLVITPKLHLGEHENSPVRRYYSMPHQLSLLRQAEMVMTQTVLEAEFLIECGVSSDRLRVVGLGIDIERVTGGDAERARQAFGVDGPIVLALGALAFDKGSMHLVQAIHAANRTRAVPITLICAGPIMSEFQVFYDRLDDDLKANVRVPGFVDDQLRTDLLAACTLLALPSRTEAFGYVFLEAWANGKPVIGARAGGIPAVIDHERNGLLVAFGDVNDLASAITRILDDDDLARELGEAGRQNVVDESQWYGKVRDVYCEVLGIGTSPEDGSDGPGTDRPGESQSHRVNAG